MKKIACCLGVMVLFSQAVFAVAPATVALYTNAADGATVTLTLNISVTNAPTANVDGTVTGIAFNDGSGAGALAGSGDLSVYNIADATGGGARTLSAADGYNMDLASYTGDVTVQNNRSAFTNNSSPAYARAYANGFDGAITNAGDIAITVTAVGGTDLSTEGNAYADATARGVGSNIYGDFGGTINATAIGGRASGLNSANAGATADGLNGDIRGNMTGTITVSATGGVAVATTTASYPRPNAYASAEGCNSDIAGDLTGTINATAVGGTASSYYEASAYASAYGVDGSVDGNLTGTVNLTSIGGTATGTTSYATAFARAQAVTEVEGAMSGDIVVDSFGGTAVSTGGTSDAYAEAFGIRNKAGGDVSGTIDVTAVGGSAIGGIEADANADAFGIEGDVFGNVSGTIGTCATGGVASAAVDGAHATAYAHVDTTAYGIKGDVIGDGIGTLEVSATGGLANSVAYNSTANAHSIASAEVLASGINGDVTGDVGTINITAIGGTATATGVYAYARSYASATGIRGEQTLGDITGSIDATATGGIASSTVTGSVGSSEASAYASGIYNEVFIGDVIGSINATATGGTATSSREAIASARAFGIKGDTVIISNFTGNISATAVAGLEILDAPPSDAIAASEPAGIAIAPPPPSTIINVADAYATAIYASDYLYLNAVTGSIHAVVEAPQQFSVEDLGEDSFAYAIKSGKGDDVVRLGNMDIIGDVDLGGGVNEIYVFGTTRVQGDVSATGGQNNYRFELYEDEANPLNPKLIVERLFAGTNSTIAAYAAEGQIAKNIVGNSYEVIEGDEIDGTFVENAASLFDLAILQSATNVMITATGLKGQDVSGNSVARATVNSALFVLNDLSAHSGAMRSLMRGQGSAPEGPAGPEAEKLADGEWAVFARQFNDLGSQDSEGALAGYDWQTSGFMLGAERLLNPNLILGAAAGGAWTDLDGKTGAGGASEQFISSLYLNYFDETWYLESGLFYSRADNDAQRISTDLQRYMGSYDSTLYGVWMEYGHTLPGKNSNLEPYVRTSYVSGNHEGYTDAGGTNPLTVDDNGTDNWLIELGLRDRRSWELENGMICGLELKAAWQHELLDNAVKANATLLNVGQTPTSPAADRDALALGIKLDVQTTDAVTVGVEYAPTIAGNWYNHSINATLKIDF